jgi:hypothetical protein
MRNVFTAAALGFTLMTAPVFAAEPTPIADAATTAVAALEVPASQADFRTRVEDRLHRPGALPAMYAASVALQGYDAYSTLTALKAGGVEANPMMKTLTKSPAAFIAIKAGTAALSIMAAENMWKSGHKAAAIGVMVASNIAMSVVAANNARVLSQMK